MKALLAADDARHGTRNGYSNLGCRCDRCRVAHAEAQRADPGRSKRYRARLAARGLNAHGKPYKQPAEVARLGGGVVIGSVAEAARAARAVQVAAAEAREAARVDERVAEERRLDAVALGMVAGHPWVVTNLPGVPEWVLLARPAHGVAAVHPVGEPDLVFLVSASEAHRVRLAADPPVFTGRTRQWNSGACHVSTLAEIGEWLEDRDLARAARAVVGEEIQP